MNEVILQNALGHEWVRFHGPVAVLTAETTAQVRGTLRDLEQAVNERGLYAAGFIAYHAAPAFDAALQAPAAPGLPPLRFGLFAAAEPFRLPNAPAARDYAFGPWEPTLTPQAYAAAVRQIKALIHQGETYQVNFTFALEAAFDGEPWPCFLDLVHSQAPCCAAFLETERWSICSVSPELFFELERDQLESRPMKGTVARGLTLAQDHRRAAALRRSPKNRAENVMIVDMVRNDLGKVAVPGSVTVPHMFALERYPNVWQMTSTVRGRTQAGVAETFQALFPCASVTGAPKVNTMRHIAALEPGPRGLYTGAIGFIAPGRRARFSVAIRTVILDRLERRASYGIGSGIVWDSLPQTEYAECLAKARVLHLRPPDFQLLETLLWAPSIGYDLLEEHLRRLADSAAYFGFAVDLRRVRTALARLSSSEGVEAGTRRTPGAGPAKIRLLVARDGQFTLETAALTGAVPAPASRVCLAPKPIDSTDPFLYHKTTRRRVYEEALAARPGFEDVLLWNEKGEVTESAIANLVYEWDGLCYTPPVRCGLLAGVYRGQLLRAGTLRERVLHKDELRRAARLWLINSVRKQWPAVLHESL